MTAGSTTPNAWHVVADFTEFINDSIREVMITLIEAMVLVFLVMFLFLQNIRYTLIPTIVVPIALLGMSFLNRMEMQRDGSTMTLKKRF
mgnify:CR=1 FL=1